MKTLTKHIPKSVFLALTFAVAIGISSCGDSTTGTNGGGNGNGNGNGNGGSDEIGTEPTFDNIEMIFETSCGGSGCHIGERMNGVRLDSYTNVIESEGLQYEELVVQPGDADGSPLVDKIESSEPEFGVRMPEGGPYLSNDRINQIKQWINNGAENDESDDSGSGNGDDDGDDGGNGGY
jgi:hypothetical protein